MHLHFAGVSIVGLLTFDQTNISSLLSRPRGIIGEYIALNIKNLDIGLFQLHNNRIRVVHLHFTGVAIVGLFTFDQTKISSLSSRP